MEVSRGRRHLWERCPVKTQVGTVELFGIGGGFRHLLSPLIFCL